MNVLILNMNGFMDIYRAYKKDSKGNIRLIEFQSQGPMLIQRSGLLDGALVEHSKECAPKNVGKSNETTAEQQAQKEAEAKWQKKIREGYFASIDCADNIEVIKPMLAIEYAKVKDKIKYPVWVQPKLDGMRCLAFCKGEQVELRSRDNKVIDTVPHVYAALRKLNVHAVLDGELYAHGLGFQDNMKLIKKDRPESTQIQYHIYDIVNDDPYTERAAKLNFIPVELSTVLTTVSKRAANSKADIDIWNEMYVKDGYEGSIIRWGTVGYQKNKRSNYLVKYKQFDDIALVIQDIVPMEARPTWGMVICTMGDKQVKATPKLSAEEREDLLKNKQEWIGKTAEIRYFGLTDDGNLRFPVCVGLRLDKDSSL